MLEVVVDRIASEFKIKNKTRLWEVITGNEKVPLGLIAELVCAEFGITLEQLKAKSAKNHYVSGDKDRRGRRARYFVNARTDFAHKASKYYTVTEIGDFLQLHYSTIIHHNKYRKPEVPPIKHTAAPVPAFERLKGEYTNIKSNYL